MRIISTIVVLAIVTIGLTFAILNSSLVTLNYYFGTRTFSLSILLALTLGLGAFIGILLITPTLLRLKRKSRQLKRKIKQAEQEIGNLRSIPLKDTH